MSPTCGEARLCRAAPSVPTAVPRSRRVPTESGDARGRREGRHRRPLALAAPDAYGQGRHVRGELPGVSDPGVDCGNITANTTVGSRPALRERPDRLLRAGRADGGKAPGCPLSACYVSAPYWLDWALSGTALTFTNRGGTAHDIDNLSIKPWTGQQRPIRAVSVVRLRVDCRRGACRHRRHPVGEPAGEPVGRGARPSSAKPG